MVSARLRFPMRPALNKSGIVISALLLLFVLRPVGLIAEWKPYTVIREASKTARNCQTLVLLHGYGSNEQDMHTLARSFATNIRVVSIRAPYTIGKQSYCWFDVNFAAPDSDTTERRYNKEQMAMSVEGLTLFITELRKRYCSHNEELYLGGFSQGAVMSYAVGLRHPELLSGIIVMSGRLVGPSADSILRAPALSALRIFISHGTEDVVLSVRRAREARDRLTSFGLKPSYHEYTAAHAISPAMLIDLRKWLEIKH